MVNTPTREEVLEGLREHRVSLADWVELEVCGASDLDALDRAIGYLEKLKSPSDYREEAAGMVLAFVDQARLMRPPGHLSAEDALRTYADFAESAARDFFGSAWDLVRGQTALAAARRGVHRVSRGPDEIPS